jgi:N-methylhydantoinase B
MQAHMTNTRNTPIEALEHSYPFHVIETRIRRGSGGAGRWRGGDGVVRTLELGADARVTVISERRTRGPYGRAGGASGAPGRNRVGVRGRARAAPGKFMIDLPRGAVLTVATPGGGGFGRPFRQRLRK